MCWQQNNLKAQKNHYKTYPKMKNKLQISTCVMFVEIQKRSMKTMNEQNKSKKTLNKQLIPSGWLTGRLEIPLDRIWASNKKTSSPDRTQKSKAMTVKSNSLQSEHSVFVSD